MLAVALGAGCGSDGGGAADDGPSGVGAPTGETDDTGETDETDAPAPGGGADGTITVDAGTFELEATTCQLGSDTSPFGIAGQTPDGAYTFGATGIAGAATISFEETGTANLWTVIGGTPEIDGNTFAYDGPALRNADDGGDPATTMTVTIRC